MNNIEIKQCPEFTEFFELMQQRYIESLDLKERLAGLEPKEILAGLKPEEILAGLKPEEMEQLAELLKKRKDKHFRDVTKNTA